MRLWSIHPVFLDRQGLVALWREGLLAKKVLEDGTRGYRNHPQLHRFRVQSDPLSAINFYLHVICDEAETRGYSFNREKLSKRIAPSRKIPVGKGQFDFEIAHLRRKLFKRSRKDHRRLLATESPNAHPLFTVRPGGIEEWEKGSGSPL